MKNFLTGFKYRKVLLAVADAFVITISALLANFILTLLDCGLRGGDLSIFILTGVICCLAGLSFSGAYHKLWRYFNQKDYISCGVGVLSGMTCSYFLTCLFRGTAPLRYMSLYGVIALIGICLFRYIFKETFIDLVNAGRNEAKYKRTMIIGGGQACRLLLNEIRNSQDNKKANAQIEALFQPVCIIDDDKNKIGMEINGVQIVGTTADIKKFIDEMKIEQLIFCIPSCMEEERRRILEICSRTQLPVKVIPFLGNLLFDESHPNLLHQVRDIKVEDLLGREPIKFDNQEIKNFISGKICMVTGGGGSIGSELVRQIVKYHPKQIILIDIYENNAYDVQQELFDEYGRELNLVTLIASVRDYYRMNQIFQKYRPQVVFHAAAHKHVPLMEDSPMEAIKNNVLGTFNTATLAQYYNIEKFVMISTDKAVNPTNVMGASKRCCEMIVQYLAQQNDGKTKFVTTRFGNVLGSNGSVIPRFKKQIEAGLPVTVTHPDIIRYFMTIPEAVSLVMEAAAIAEGSEITRYGAACQNSEPCRKFNPNVREKAV